MEALKEKVVGAIVDLFKVKSLITIALFTVLCIMTIRGYGIMFGFDRIIFLVSGFYFGAQSAKQKEGAN